MRRVVITGGPASGKSSLIESLASKGYATFPEVAREVIKQQLELGTNKVPWDDVTEFSKIVLKDQIKQFDACIETITFFDRGIPDLIGYMNHGDFKIFPYLMENAQNKRYDNVFILPPWREIYSTDNERRENINEAALIFDEIKKAYQSLNYKPIIVPKISIEERATFILNNING